PADAMQLAQRTGAHRDPEVRYRPGSPGTEAGALLVRSVPGASWDRGLQSAAEALLGTAVGPRVRLDTRTTSGIAARAGYPGQVRFATRLNGGAFPADAVDSISADARGRTVDVALARRTWSDGMSLWVFAWAPRLLGLNPLPRDVGLDGSVPVTVHGGSGEELRLFVAPPDAPVAEVSLTPAVTRWVDRFHTPGEYRLEVVRRSGQQSEVALLFSIFVDDPPAPAGVGGATPPATPHPVEAERALVLAVNELRRKHGLPRVEVFEMFVPFAREHAALMAASGVVAHRIPGVTPGVPTKAAEYAHPRALHYENVAVAATAEETLARVVDSPGHLRNLLCETCTHVAIGASLEPVLDRQPRLFVTYELLAFPQGPPRKIDHYNR
ncbi:MAG: CAP domain-containing protein, partial [Myxococcota bacterium]|nr:CAP domain-containing protein [Myxococcota bacterium]